MLSDLPPQTTTEFITNKNDSYESWLSDSRYSLVVSLVDEWYDWDPSSLEVYFSELTSISLDGTFPLPNGDHFQVDGPKAQIIYHRKLANSRLSIERWDVSFWPFNGAIVGLAYTSDGRLIASKFGSGVLEWEELWLIFSQLSQNKTYNRKKMRSWFYVIGLVVSRET